MLVVREEVDCAFVVADEADDASAVVLAVVFAVVSAVEEEGMLDDVDCSEVEVAEVAEEIEEEATVEVVTVEVEVDTGADVTDETDKPEDESAAK